MSALIDPLERRRRLAMRFVVGALVVGVGGVPLGFRAADLAVSMGSTDPDFWGGVFIMAALLALFLGTIVLKIWRDYTEQHLFDAVLARRPEIGARNGDEAQAASALAAEAPEVPTFRAGGTAGSSDAACHIVSGQAAGVPFVLAAYRAAGGALASFRLARARPGLTIVTRDRGPLGNLLANVGRDIQRVTLEDPAFEELFEAYGDDQVEARRVLTATMLERLKALDEVSGAGGFTCAVSDGHLLLAFEGVRWRPEPWHVLVPLDRWRPAYERRLEALIDLPAAIVPALRLDGRTEPPAVLARATSPAKADVSSLIAAYGTRGATPVVERLGAIGLGLAYLASGTLFGGLAAFFGLWGLEHGFEGLGGAAATVWLMIALGLAYGIGAGLMGLRAVVSTLWEWGTPAALRAVHPGRGNAP